MMASYRVNNLTVRRDRYSKVWQVITPDKCILEEFAFERDAILFAQNTHDFLTDLGYKRKYGRTRRGVA